MTYFHNLLNLLYIMHLICQEHILIIKLLFQSLETESARLSLANTSLRLVNTEGDLNHV